MRRGARAIRQRRAPVTRRMSRTRNNSKARKFKVGRMRATARGSKTPRRVQTTVQATHLPHRAHPSSSSPPRGAHSRAARSRASRARHKPRLLRVARSPSPERSLRRRRWPRRRGTRSRRRRSSLTTCRGRTRIRRHLRVLRLEGVSFVRASPVRPWRMTHARARSPYLSWPIICSSFVGGNRAALRGGTQ